MISLFTCRLQCLAGTVKVNLKYVKGRLESKASELTPNEKVRMIIVCLAGRFLFVVFCSLVPFILLLYL